MKGKGDTMFKKMTALFLAAMLVCSLAGCESGSAGGKTGGGENSSSSSSGEAAPSAQPEGMALATTEDSEEAQIISGAAVAVKYVADQLEDPESIEVESIFFKNTLGSYFYKITYTATDNLDGKIEDCTYVRTSTAEFDYSTAQGEKEGPTKVRLHYDLGGDTTAVDADRVMELYQGVFG